MILTQIPVISGSKPIELKPGSPIFLGHFHPNRPIKTAACGHLLAATSDSVTLYSPGYRSESKLLHTLTKDLGAEFNYIIYNDGCLYLMDAAPL